MRIAEVKVAKTTCETTRLVPIPKGIVGATVSIEYTDSAWDGVQKTVVFRSAVTKDVLNAGSEVVIPAEVVSRAGVNLYMGVYGVDSANNVVIPTIWTELGLVHGAAAPSGDSSTDPSLPVWAQIQAAIGNLDDLNTVAKSSLVAAVNEALTKGGGEVDPVAVQKIVDDYLKANPPGAGADGKDGITPTIGENGNWYLGDTDTGKPSRGADGAVPDIQIGTVTTLPAGSNATASMGGTAENPLLNLGIPKGADGQGSGSGGTDISLGLTSATVGQTIKVKAVGTDGKPTAWEAADLPAGAGETWQFITEITLDDAVNVVTINKDANGNSFALKRVMIDCVIKLNTDDPFTTINTKLNGFASASNASPTSNTLNPRYYSFYAEIIPGSGALCWHVCNGTNYNWGSDMLKMGYKYNNLWQSDAITSLTIQANDGYKNIGLAGTKINVLGVRA